MIVSCLVLLNLDDLGGSGLTVVRSSICFNSYCVFMPCLAAISTASMTSSLLPDLFAVEFLNPPRGQSSLSAFKYESNFTVEGDLPKIVNSKLIIARITA